MSSVTIKDVAARTGVSVSTVNKALYDKPGVSAEKRAQIIEAAQEMGYRPSRAAMSLASSRIRIGVVLPSAWPSYHEAIKEGILKALDSLHDFFITSEICYYDAAGNAGEHVRAAFEELKNRGCDAVIFTPGERDSYFNALEWAHTAHLPTALAGDARPDAPCLFSVETDVAACAKMAADFMKISVPEDRKLAVVTGWSEFEPHRRKAQIFEEASGRNVLRIDGYDTDSVIYERLTKLIAEHPDIGGVYVATSTCDGAVRAIREQNRKIRLVTTDLSAHTYDDMKAGWIDAVIYQNTALQGALAVFALADHLTMRITPPAVRLVAPRLYLESSCPKDAAAVLDELVIRS